jgi:Spy/CpxP family protein refolding chaperone
MSLRSIGFFCFVFALLTCGLAQAQGPGGPGGFFGGGADMGLTLLRDENVRKELDLVEDQEKKIEALGEKMRDGMRSIFEGGRDLKPEDREKFFAEAREKMTAKTAELRKEFDEVLLPQQRDRLKQIALQARMRYQSASEALSSTDASEALKLTDEQKEKMTAKQKELDEEYRKEAEKLRNKYRDKLLEVLTPEQQAKWKEMVGNPIEFAPQQFGRGGRGGPGGGTRGPGGEGGNGGTNN